MPTSVPKPGPTTIIRQPTATKLPKKDGSEIVNFRPVLRSRVTLANRRLQPLGHLTANAKYTGNPGSWLLPFLFGEATVFHSGAIARFDWKIAGFRNDRPTNSGRTREKQRSRGDLPLARVMRCCGFPVCRRTATTSTSTLITRRSGAAARAEQARPSCAEGKVRDLGRQIVDLSTAIDTSGRPRLF